MAIQLTEPQMNATYTVSTCRSLTVLSESLAEVSQDDADMLASINTGKPVIAVNGVVRFVVYSIHKAAETSSKLGLADITGQPVEIIK